ncbi:MAG: hypothetical protein HUK28_03520 [Methanobrevibacter sp.]|nr:hypothetical protein [Methanobrevibacter sp.]
MNKTQLKYIIFILYVAIIIIFILGILTADIYLFVASTILFILTIPIILKHPDIIYIPKKLNIGSEIAFEKTFYVSNIIIFYISIAIITLRDNYPSWGIVGYVLFAVVIMNLVIFKIIQKNVEKEYLR